MADFNQGNRPQRKKTALDNSKLNMSAPCPTAPGKISALTWQFIDNNPRIVVYTRDPADNTEKTGYGKIVAKMDSPSVFAIFETILSMIDKEPGTKVKCENKNFTFFGGKRSDAPQVLTEIWTGKDKDGCIWISVTARDRPVIKFIFGGTDYHHFYHGDGTPFTAAESSVAYAKGNIKLLSAIYQHLHITEYKEPEPWNPQQKQGGNSGGGYNNRGQQPQQGYQSPRSDDDLPF